MNDKVLIVSTTFDNKKDAEMVAKRLLEKRLIACGQISQAITSLYRWKGTLESDAEYVLQVKTLAKMYGQVEENIKEHHPYETPEIIAISCEHVSREYLEWMKEEIK